MRGHYDCVNALPNLTGSNKIFSNTRYDVSTNYVFLDHVIYIVRCGIKRVVHVKFLRTSVTASYGTNVLLSMLNTTRFLISKTATIQFAASSL
jgi:hypothetical protein